MPTIREIVNGDYQFHYEICFGDDEWVNQSTTAILYISAQNFLISRFNLTIIDDDGYKCRLKNESGDIVEIINDSACYWIDFAAIKITSITNVQLRQAAEDWIVMIENAA